MRKRIILLLPLLMIFMSQKAQVTKTDRGIILENFGCSTHLLKVEVISSHIIHLMASPTGNFSDNDREGLKGYDLSGFSLKIDSERITLKTDVLRVFIDPKNGRVTFRDKENHLLLEENNRFYKPYKVFLENTWSVKQEFKWASDEALYDLNQLQGGMSNIRGRKLDLISPGTREINSLILSSKGYGLFWNNNSLSRFYDGNDCSYLWSEMADQVNYYFMYGPSNEEVVYNYRKLTGKLLVLPKWAMGNLHSGTNIEVQKNSVEVDQESFKKDRMSDITAVEQAY